MTMRPNILLITAHDLGTMLGCYGADPVLSTPVLDGLAGAGVRFENHFATAAFCSPSRGGIVTGKVPHANGLMGLVNLGWDLPMDQITIGSHLRQAGYRTALIGLQHEAADPTRLGFDELHCEGSRASGPVVDRAIDWLSRQEPGSDRPFYLQVGFADVHRAFPDRSATADDLASVAPLPYLEDTPGLREDLWDFYGLIETMDANVGRLLQALEEIGLADGTLVIFTTDHGIAFPRAKATLYDPGIHTTLIMRGPGEFRGGRTFGELISNVDLLPTLLEMIGADVPDDIQGQSFLPLVEGGPYETREFVFAETNTTAWNVARCVRTRTHKYIETANPGPLWHFPTDIERSKTRRDMGAAPVWHRPAREFYDLVRDPLEQHNLAEIPEYSEMQERHAYTLRQFQRQTGDPLLRGAIPRPADEAEILGRILADIPTAKRPE